MDHSLPPRPPILVQRVRKKIIQQQVLQLRILIERRLDISQERTTNNAATTPHQRDAAHIQIPVLVLLHCTKQHVALRIAHHLRAIKRPPHIFNKLFLLRDRFNLLRPFEHLRSRNPLILQRRQAPRKHALPNQCHRLPQVQRRDSRPLPRSFLSRRIQNLVEHRQPVLILLRKDRRRNLNQVTIELTLVPLRKHLGKLVRRQPQSVLQKLIGLANQLNIAILNSVVHHLHVVPCAILAHPVAARCTILHLRRNRLKDLLHMRPRRSIASRHNRRSKPRAFFSTRDSRPDKQNPLRRKLLRPPIGIGKQGVPAINQNVALLQIRQHMLNRLVDHLARLHHQHHAPRQLQRRA